MVKIIVILVVVVLLFLGIQIYYSHEKMKDSVEQLERWMKSKNLDTTNPITFFNGNFGYRIYPDEEHRLFVFLNTMPGKKLYVKYKDIESVEILEDGKTYDDKATSKTIKDLVVLVHLEDGEIIRMVLNSNKIHRTNKDYIDKINFAEKLKETIEDNIRFDF